jgi:transcription-repair coupling factor (superfamily II helicase)
MLASALANHEGRDLFVVCATLEAGRVHAQMEAMGWQSVHFYPTAEASPYEPFDPETELIWGQIPQNLMAYSHEIVKGSLNEQLIFLVRQLIETTPN